MSSTVMIPENFELNSVQAAELLGVSQSRIFTLLGKDPSLAHRGPGGPGRPGNYKIPFSSIDRLRELDASTRSVGHSASLGRLDRLQESVEALDRRLSDLEQFLDEYTASEVAPPSATR